MPGLGLDDQALPGDINDPHPDRVADSRLEPARAPALALGRARVPGEEISGVAPEILANLQHKLRRGPSADRRGRRALNELRAGRPRHCSTKIGG